MSINQLAAAIGMTRVSVGNMIAGRQSPPLEKLERIANALNVNIYDLFEKPYNVPPDSAVTVCPHCGRKLRITVTEDE